MGTRATTAPALSSLRFQGYWVTLGSGVDPADTVDRDGDRYPRLAVTTDPYGGV